MKTTIETGRVGDFVASLRMQKDWLLCHVERPEAKGLTYLVDAIRDALVDEGLPEDYVCGAMPPDEAARIDEMMNDLYGEGD